MPNIFTTYSNLPWALHIYKHTKYKIMGLKYSKYKLYYILSLYYIIIRIDVDKTSKDHMSVGCLCSVVYVFAGNLHSFRWSSILIICNKNNKCQRHRTFTQAWRGKKYHNLFCRTMTIHFMMKNKTFLYKMVLG